MVTRTVNLSINAPNLDNRGEEQGGGSITVHSLASRELLLWPQYGAGGGLPTRPYRYPPKETQIDRESRKADLFIMSQALKCHSYKCYWVFSCKKE